MLAYVPMDVALPTSFGESGFVVMKGEKTWLSTGCPLVGSCSL